MTTQERKAERASVASHQQTAGTEPLAEERERTGCTSTTTGIPMAADFSYNVNVPARYCTFIGWACGVNNYL